MPAEDIQAKIDDLKFALKCLQELLDKPQTGLLSWWLAIDGWKQKIAVWGEQ